MTFISRSTLLLASLLLAATPTAFAQTTGTGGNNPTPRSSSSQAVGVPRDENSHVPGATGEAIVKGDRSTVAGDSHATAEQKTGEVSGGR